MTKLDDNSGATYGPSWQDVAEYSRDVFGATGWQVTWEAHVENIAGRVRTYWKVHARRPSRLGAGYPPVYTRGDFFPSVMSKTVPALLHRLIAQVDADLAKAKDGAEQDLPLLRRG